MRPEQQMAEPTFGEATAPWPKWKADSKQTWSFHQAPVACGGAVESRTNERAAADQLHPKHRKFAEHFAFLPEYHKFGFDVAMLPGPLGRPSLCAASLHSATLVPAR
jgi:hypothetical protein